VSALAIASALATISIITALPAAVTAAQREEGAPETVASVDLNRYLGTWYEIASIPNRFQRHCQGNTTAEYQRDQAGRLRVINSCLADNGRVETAAGVARVVDGSGNAKLEVSFVSVLGWRPFWGDYWILDLAPDYSYAIIGTPDYRYGWILSRMPAVSDDLRHQLNDRLRQVGYSKTEFQDTPQGLSSLQLQPDLRQHPTVRAQSAAE
jgi:apolipoprotein D and lipocalin family protein